MDRLNIQSSFLEKKHMIYPLPKMSESKKDHIYYLGNNELMKVFTSGTDVYVSSKVKSVLSLMEEQNEMDIGRINYPTGIVTVDGTDQGYLMNFIYGKSLNVVLRDTSLPFEIKKQYLKEIGLLLEDMKEVRENTRFKNFYINDIHEKNFICKEDGSIKAIDVDSFHIDDDVPISPAMYLRPRIRLTPYIKYNNTSTGYKSKEVVPSYDTEIYCYSVMILNFLLGEKIIYMNTEEFNNYLKYLESLGFDKELINIFSRLHSEKPNVNPVELVDTLIDDPYTRRRYYQKTKRK